LLSPLFIILKFTFFSIESGWYTSCISMSRNTRVPIGQVEVITSKVLRSPPWLHLVDHFGIFVSQMTTDMFHFCFSFMTYHRVCNYINTTGSTSGAGIAYPSGASEFTSICSGVGVTRSVVLCVCFVDVVCPFDLFLLAIVLSVLLQFTNSDYLPLVSSNSSYHC
jgi:hypothetical protein